MNDGGCDEFINLRYTKGAFRPIGKKEYLYPKPDYSKIWIHKTDLFENWIGLNQAANQIEWYNPDSKAIIQTISTIEGAIIDVKFLKKYLIVITATELIIFLYNNNAYANVSQFTQPELELLTDTYGEDTTESATDAAGLIGKWYKLINELSADDDKSVGTFTYRAAYKLYDGTFVLHTTPVALNINVLPGLPIQQHLGIVKNTGGNFTIELTAYHPGIITFLPFYYFNFPEDIITSVVIFASRVETLWNIEDTITDDALALISSGSQEDFSDIGILNDNFEKIDDPAAFYQVAEVPLSVIKTGIGSITDERYFDFTNFYSNYATRKTLPVDDNSHSKLTGLAPYIYNDRIILGNTVESFDVPRINITEPLLAPIDRSFQVQVKIQSSIGEIWVISDWFQAQTQDHGGGDESITFESILGYPDSRAREMLILINDGAVTELVGKWTNTIGAKTDTHLVPWIVGASDFSESQTPTGTIGTSSAMAFLSATQDRVVNLIGSIIGIPTLNTEFNYYARIYDGSFVLVESIFLGTIEYGMSSLLYVNKYLNVPTGYSFEIVAITSTPADQVSYFTSVIQIFETEIAGSSPSKVLQTYLLEESIFSNYAKFSNPEFTKVYPTINVNWRDIRLEYNINTLILASAEQNSRTSGALIDSNAYAVSEIQNPFVFPVEDRGQIGTGTIIDFGTNTEPISEGQFGQYPLYAFTSEGIWALSIGLAEVFITSEAPLSREVLIRRGAKTDIAFGIVYATLEGLKMISGKKVIELSETAEGLPDQYFTDNEQLQYFLNLPQTVDVSNIVDKVRFLDYLTDANIGYNKAFDTNEIYVANPNYEYMWMFNLKHKYWTKVSGKYNQLIDFYPELYGVRATSGDEAVVNISSEIVSNVDCYFHTKALSMSGMEIFKKLHRSFLRGFFNMASGKYAAFYLFGSDDLINWIFETGNDRNSGAFNNIWLTHSPNSKRYYNYVFAAQIDFDPAKDSHIKFVEYQEKQKWSRKLR